MKKKKISKVKKIGAFLFVFPLVVGAIYALPLPQYIAVDSGDLLSYYGVVFGLYASYYTYLDEKKKAKLEHKNELSPALHVEVRKEAGQEHVFDIKITSLKKQVLTDVILYDEPICNILNDTIKLTVAFGNQKNNGLIKPDIKVSDSDIPVDKQNGYPDYIQIVCNDVERNCWVCDFQRLTVEHKNLYVPLAPRIE